MAFALYFILEFHLFSALIAGLFVHSIVHGIADRLKGRRLTHERAKVAALAIVATVLIGLTIGAAVLIIGILKGRIGAIPDLLTKMAETIDTAHGWVDKYGMGGSLPAAGMDAHQLADDLSHRLRVYSDEFHADKKAAETALHAVIGIVVGALAAFDTRTPGGPFSAALLERLRRFAAAFQVVVFAQIRISALNTALTAIYIEIVLRLFGVVLPLHKTLILLTFLLGLLPVVGNLLSNTCIVLISISVAPAVALSSLVFLIVIHKLEYFVNARILGHQIHAAAWEILAVIFAFEAVFGMHGVILAPIAYAYVKRELMDRRLI